MRIFNKRRHGIRAQREEKVAEGRRARRKDRLWGSDKDKKLNHRENGGNGERFSGLFFLSLRALRTLRF
jgi:hypothetical protein